MKSHSKNEQTMRAGPIPFSKKEQLIEVCVFLFLIAPSLVLSFFAVKQGSLGFVLTAVATTLRDLALVSLIFFFLWRNGEPLVRIGWAFAKGWRDIGLGIVLFIPLTFATVWLDNALRAAGFSAPSSPQPSLLNANDPGQFLLAFVLVLVVAVAEETIFRGYLILRLRSVTASLAVAVLLSAVIFSLGHGYEGTVGVVTVGVMGFIFALVYEWRDSLVAPIVMHFLQDFVAIILLPLLGTK